LKDFHDGTKFWWRLPLCNRELCSFLFQKHVLWLKILYCRMCKDHQRQLSLVRWEVLFLRVSSCMHDKKKKANILTHNQTFVLKLCNISYICKVHFTKWNINNESVHKIIYRLNDFVFTFNFSGSNLLLHRLLIEKGIPDNLQFLSFDSDTNLCSVIYVSRK
jgi:hypothetical protein